MIVLHMDKQSQVPSAALCPCHMSYMAAHDGMHMDQCSQDKTLKIRGNPRVYFDVSVLILKPAHMHKRDAELPMDAQETSGVACANS